MIKALRTALLLGLDVMTAGATLCLRKAANAYESYRDAKAMREALSAYPKDSFEYKALKQVWARRRDWLRS